MFWHKYFFHIVATDLPQSTMEEKHVAAQKKLCFESPRGLLIKKEASGAVWSCQEAAEQGDVNAQFSLGLMSDPDKSAKWYRLAAEQGHKTSQAMLGFKYSKGTGVDKDLVSAHMWISLASNVASFVPSDDLDETEKQKYFEDNKSVQMEFAKIIEGLEKQMTASQIVEAKKQAEGCLVRKFKWC